MMPSFRQNSDWTCRILPLTVTQHLGDLGLPEIDLLMGADSYSMLRRLQGVLIEPAVKDYAQAGEESTYTIVPSSQMTLKRRIVKGWPFSFRMLVKYIVP